MEPISNIPYYLIIGLLWLYVIASAFVLVKGIRQDNPKFVKMGSVMLLIFFFLMSGFVLMAALFLKGYEPDASLVSNWIFLGFSIVCTLYFATVAISRRFWPLNRTKDAKK